MYNPANYRQNAHMHIKCAELQAHACACVNIFIRIEAHKGVRITDAPLYIHFVNSLHIIACALLSSTQKHAQTHIHTCTQTNHQTTHEIQDQRSHTAAP